jgi:hypothetical protein
MKLYDSINENPGRAKKNNDTKEQANKIKIQDLEGVKEDITV